MYLADRDIMVRLAELNIVTPSGFEPFDPAAQVQPCSIDLRLGVKFWRQRQSKDIDLLSARHMTPISRRDWDESTLRPHESIRIKPGEMVLGHTLEAFQLPHDLAGKLEGRSSYGRLGLSIHASADFINPGWSGRMPLPLINHNPSTLRLYPGMPICQLMLIPLSSPPERIYGAKELWSKYENDDGGPSYWWRDRHIKTLVETMRKSNYSIDAQQQVLNLLDDASFDIGPILDRLESFINRRRSVDIESVDEMLRAFAHSEDQVSRYQTWGKGVSAAAVAIFVGAFLSSLAAGSHAGWLVAFALGTIIASAAYIYIQRRGSSYYLTTDHLRERKRNRERSPDLLGPRSSDSATGA